MSRVKVRKLILSCFLPKMKGIPKNRKGKEGREQKIQNKIEKNKKRK